jgi:hypothetical protein
MDRAQPGPDHDDEWADYKLWLGDLWSCPECGHEIVIGALRPLSEHYEPGYQAALARCPPTIRINDC